MTHRTLLRFTLLIIFTLAFAALAYGQPQRTFVSAQTGNDANTANNCSLLQPCRNFNAAIGVVNTGGEVVALDSGGYGAATINKAVTLTSPSGVYAAISALTAGTSAITVNTAGSTVVIRGLTLTGLGGATGINVTAVGTLHVEGCVISGFTGPGIFVSLTATGSQVFIKDTVTRNNDMGVQVQTSTGTVSASIDNSRAERNTNNGFYAGNNSRVTINRSVASGNLAGAGFLSSGSGAGVSAELGCEECVGSGNAYGFAVNTAAGATATIRVSHSTGINNSIAGFAQIAGLFESLSNNLVRGNTSDTTGTITAVAAQ